MSMIMSHSEPVKPGGHVAARNGVLQVPPFKHGLAEAHTLIEDSQYLPVNPTGHVHFGTPGVSVKHSPRIHGLGLQTFSSVSHKLPVKPIWHSQLK